MRLCIHSGVTFPRLCDLLRDLYVNVVEHDFPLPAKQQTDSRVSLLTGIHRKEVRRLRGRGAPSGEMPKALSRTSLILARWMGVAAYTDAQGRPQPLVRSEEDGSPSFEELVASITRDIRPRAVLDDWIDRGLVDLDEAGRVHLKVDALIPDAGDEQQLYFFGRNLHDHVAASVSNVIGRRAPYMERAVHYDGLSAALAEHLEARARDIATEALRAANREAAAGCESDPGGTHRWNFGLYVYRVDEGADAAGAAPARRSDP